MENGKWDANEVLTENGLIYADEAVDGEWEEIDVNVIDNSATASTTQ